MATQTNDRNGEALTLIEKLNEDLGSRATVRIVFADPIERGNVTIIPVAKIRYGFGGGTDEPIHVGGGGGMRATPLGYIELRNGTSKFYPIYDTISIARLTLGALFLTIWAGTRIVKLSRQND